MHAVFIPGPLSFILLNKINIGFLIDQGDVFLSFPMGIKLSNCSLFIIYSSHLIGSAKIFCVLIFF